MYKDVLAKYIGLQLTSMCFLVDSLLTFVYMVFADSVSNIMELELLCSEVNHSIDTLKDYIKDVSG